MVKQITHSGDDASWRTSRTCALCQQPFTPKRPPQQYCSARCRTRFALTRMNDAQGKLARWRTSQECPRCHQPFTPARQGQQYCSVDCGRGQALDKAIATAATMRETISEKRRAELLRRTAEGRPLRKRTKAQRARADTLASEAMPAPPSVPVPGDMELSEAGGTEEVEQNEAVTGGSPLTLPLTGAETRQEWQQIGKLREAQAERQLQRDAGRGGAEPTVSAGGRTIILAGQGSYLGVEGRALVVHQGRTHGIPAPERELLYPAMHGVRRILWVGAHGYLSGTLTLAAAAFCRREGIQLIVLDGSGEPLLMTTPDYPHNAQLRRRQWLVSGSEDRPTARLAGSIARAILQRKTERQYRTLASHLELPGQADALQALGDWCVWLNLPNPPAWQYDLDHLRRVEAKLAYAYFRAWEGWPLTWAKTDIRRLPPHWLTARTRTSPLAPNGNARHAVDPLNACLNYCYGCLASQCRQALYAEGFDLACGFLHSDRAGRDSLTYDLMELERGAVDGLVLDFLGHTMLHYADFARAADGSLSLHPQLTRLLLASCRVPQSRVDSHAKWLRRLLLNGEAQSIPGREDGPAE
jgi:CRISPR-associated endonuclease Cas1